MVRNKRRSTRVEVRFPVNLEGECPGSSECPAGLIENLSCRGVLVATDVFHPADSRIFLDLPLPTCPRSFRVRARVIRVTEQPGGYRYRIAGEFESLDAEDCLVFSDLIASVA